MLLPCVILNSLKTEGLCQSCIVEVINFLGIIHCPGFIKTLCFRDWTPSIIR